MGSARLRGASYRGPHALESAGKVFPHGLSGAPGTHLREVTRTTPKTIRQAPPMIREVILSLPPSRK